VKGRAVPTPLTVLDKVEPITQACALCTKWMRTPTPPTTAIGTRERALEQLEASARDRSPYIHYVFADPRLASCAVPHHSSACESASSGIRRPVLRGLERITLQVLERPQWPLPGSRPKIFQGPLVTATGFPRGSPQADFGRPGHLAESQLPGAASYSHWRPEAVLDGMISATRNRTLQRPPAGSPATLGRDPVLRIGDVPGRGLRVTG
jgi:hypothetical protein